MSSECPQYQTPDPRVLLAHYLRQIEARHISTPHHAPLMLHWDSQTGALVEYAWPCDSATDERIVPCSLEEMRRTHYFKSPCCLCAFLDGTDYTEARIGVVETVNKDGFRNQSILHGEYVAVCARQRCGYFLCVERFYCIPSLAVRICRKRAKPLAASQLTLIYDVEKSFREGDGLFQVMSNVNVRGSRRDLQKLDPLVAMKKLAGVVEEVIRGVTEQRFYAIFAQCMVCKTVMFREDFAANHASACVDRNARKYHPYRRPKAPTIAPRLEFFPSDLPEQGSSSHVPTFHDDSDILDTECEDDGEGDEDTECEDPASDGATSEPDEDSDGPDLPTVPEIFAGRGSR